MISYEPGTIRKLAGIRQDNPPVQIPQTLSATGLLSNTASLEWKRGIAPYEINSPLWSDGAIKSVSSMFLKGKRFNLVMILPWSSPEAVS